MVYFSIIKVKALQNIFKKNSKKQLNKNKILKYNSHCKNLRRFKANREIRSNL